MMRCNDESQDRKSTRLNSSHMSISYAVFCLKKKKKDVPDPRHRQYRRKHPHKRDLRGRRPFSCDESPQTGGIGRYAAFTLSSSIFFFNATATTEIYTLSLHDALPISSIRSGCSWRTCCPASRRKLTCSAAGWM